MFKKIQFSLLLLFVLSASSIYAQGTVCYGDTFVYATDLEDGANGSPGSIYQWSVLEPIFAGTITGQPANSNVVSISWDTTPTGSYTIQVLETDSTGTVLPAVTYPITVLPAPTVSGPFSTCVLNPILLIGVGVPDAQNPWTSSNSLIATVTPVGLVIGVSPGTVTITFTNSNGCEASRTLTVFPAPIIEGSDTICENGTLQLTTTSNPSSTQPWTSSNTSVATISNTGTLNAIANGTTTITFTATNGCTATKEITVGLTTLNGNDSVCANETIQLLGNGTANAVSPYVSSNNAVATVDNSGLVTGISGGTATITYTDSNNCTGTKNITVSEIIISGNSELCVSNTMTLTSNGSSGFFSPWSSSNTNIATINNNGLVTGIQAGTTTISFQSTNGCSGSKEITVYTTPTITGNSTICLGSNLQLSGSGVPSNATPWTSSDTSIATVNTLGLVTGIVNGSVTITYTNSNNCSATKIITVGESIVTGLAEVCIGSSIQLTGNGTPSSISPYSSSDTLVATVDNTGLVTGISNGSVIITYTDNNNCTGTKQINVISPTITGFDEVCVSGSIQLTSSGSSGFFSPWSSANNNIASVSYGGVVTGNSAGTVDIYFEDNQTGCVGTKTITVIPSPTISGGNSICANNTLQLTGSGTPNSSTPWTSSDNTIATVDNNGLVTGVLNGNVIISYTASNGCSTTKNITIGGINLNGNNSICINATTQFSGSGVPNANNPYVSSDTSIATVSSTGVVTGISGGTATITYTDNNNCTATKSILVDAPVISGIDTICVSSTTQFTGTGSGNFFTPWSSSNNNIASVSYGGVVTGNSAGTVTITYQNNSGCVGTKTITVIPSPTISGGNSICANNTLQLTGSGTPNSSTPWTSSDNTIATVDNNGLVTGVLNGNVIISYTASNGCSATKNIAVQDISVSGTSTVSIGGTSQLLGSGTANTSNPWESNDTLIATVSQNGLVTGINPGTTTVFYTNDIGCIASIEITVTDSAFISGNLNICIDELSQLIGSGSPDPANPWESSDPSVATVSNLGLVTGVNIGNTTITYIDSNGSLATAILIVNELPVITGNTQLCESQNSLLTGSGIANNVTPWISSDTNVAVVASNGVVTALSSGTSNITYTNSHGCVSTVSVTVSPSPIITGNNTLLIGGTLQLISSGVANIINPWTSSDTSVATISNDGTLIGIGAGNTIVTYTNSNGCSSSVIVTVTAP